MNRNRVSEHRRERTFAARLSIVLALALAAPGRANETPASFRGVGDLPGGSVLSDANGVSLDGQVVVGRSYGVNGEEAFLWTEAGGLVPLGDLPGGGFGSEALGVSGDGSVVVGRAYNGASDERGFVWSAASGMLDVGDLPGGGGNSMAFAVSADGTVVVGVSQGASGGEAYAFTLAGGIVGLGDLPGGAFSSRSLSVSSDGSVVVGGAMITNGAAAFRFTVAGGMVSVGDLPGGALYSFAEGVSADGTVVVGSSASITGYEAFRWDAAGGMVGLGDLAGGIYYSFATAASSDGSVVVGTGSVTNASGGTSNVAFVWDVVNGMRNLRDELVNVYGLDLTGWELTVATDVSGDGRTIVGTGSRNGSREGWVARIGPAIPVRAGTVDTGAGGAPVDVVFVNGSAGAPGSRRVDVTAGVPTTLHVDPAPSLLPQRTGQYALWIYDGEETGCVDVRFMTGAGIVYTFGRANRLLPIENTVAAGAVPCPLTFPAGVTSRSLGLSAAGTLCLNAAPGSPRSPVDMSVIFPPGTFAIYSVHLDPNSPVSPAKNVSVGNTIVVVAR